MLLVCSKMMVFCLMFSQQEFDGTQLFSFFSSCTYLSLQSSTPTIHSIVCKHSHFRLLLKKQLKRLESATTTAVLRCLFSDTENKQQYLPTTILYIYDEFFFPLKKGISLLTLSISFLIFTIENGNLCI